MLALFQSFGPTELLIILGIALIIFGPTQLPKLGRSVGKAIRELRGASTEVTKAVQEGLEGKGEEEEKTSKKKTTEEEEE
jgi:TatA/E family protein of Tat protein translocase